MDKLLYIGWMILASYCSLLVADNELIIDNMSGANFSLTVTQVGAENIIKCYNTSSCYVDGDDIVIDLYQKNPNGNTSTIDIWHIEGDDNTVRWGQGVSLDDSSDTTFNTTDSTEAGGHYARIDIHGNNNNVIGYQKNNTNVYGHVFNSLIWSDNNDIWIEQKGNGRKTLNLTTYSDSNDVSIKQSGGGAWHTATITLDGTQPTTLTLNQTASTAQTYSLSQNCQTTGGCTISVNQGGG